MTHSIKNIFIKITFTLFIIVILAIPLMSFGQGSTIPGPSGTIKNPLKFDTIGEFLNALLDTIIIISVPIIVFFLIYSGFLFVKAQGNEDTINKAKQFLLYTLIGAAIILGAKAISTAIQATVDDLSISDKGSIVMNK